MGETANQIPPKGLYTLQVSDFVKGILYIVFGIVSAIIIFLLGQDHWPSWKEWQPYLITGATTLFGYISKNFFTNNVGQFAKPDEPVVTVPARELDKVIDAAHGNVEAAK